MSAAKNVLIGFFVLVAFAIIIFILLFLHPSVGDNEKVLHVLFTDIDKINIGTRVTYAGLPVGEVVKIREVPEARTGRVNHNGEIYVYELTLRVDSTVEVYNSDLIYVRTSGLLGERNIEIDPQPLKHGEKLEEIEDEIIYAEPTPTVEETLKKFGVLSDKFGILLDNFNVALIEFKDQQIIDKFSKIADNILDITKDAKETWPKIDATVQNLYDLTERAHKSWTKVDQTLDQFHQASINTRQFTEDVQNITSYAKSGRGTIGRLFMTDDLYLRGKSILHKGETAMGDVNKYGVLFHLNKQWQRTNARRINLLNRLSTPEQFANHFGNELDRISTSLSNVSMVLDETSEYPQNLMNNPEFTQRFSDLLRKVEGIEDALKMYNEQVVSQEMPPQLGLQPFEQPCQ